MDRLADRTLSATIVTDTAHDPLPRRAGTIVVGGGIIGASIALHLAEAGVDDVLLLERAVLTSGTTWHAAGLVAGARGSTAMTGLSSYGLAFYADLQQRSGLDVSFERCGSLSLARHSGRVDELAYARDVAVQNGIDARLVDPDEIATLWPIASTEGVLAGLQFANDGHVNPGYAALAMAKLAHEAGVSIREGVGVTAILHESGRATGVETERGTVLADRVVIAGGLWSRDLAATAGVHLPLYAAEHVHVRSAPIEGAVASLPVLRDVDHSYYIRHEAGRLLVGAFEPNGIPRAVGDIATTGFATFPEDWAHFSPVRTAAERTVPTLGPAGYDRFLTAPESFTPDTSFLLGETAEVEQLFVSAGLNSQGIIFAPGIGRELARWIVEGSPQFHSASVDVQRFSRHQSNRRYLHARTVESLGRLYAMHWPHLQSETARNVRRTPLHSRLAELGARFGEINGGERANWYGGPTAAEGYSYGRPGWFEQVAAEHRAAREGVALFDLSPFAKFEIVGADALAVVQHAATNDVDVAVGQAVYTLFLHRNGGIELDGTVTRLAHDRFMVVTPSTSHHKSLWLLRRAARGRSAAVVDVTAALATIGVMGPLSRELLSRVSPDDWSDAAQPYTTGREVEVADGFAYSLRISFVGELGYELYPSADLALNVLDALWDAGQHLGVRLAGYHALDSLRSEKGYRHLGHDIGATDDPYSAGLGFTVALDKPGGFMGRDAVAALDPAAPRHRTVHVSLDDPEPVFVHDETVFADGVAVGRMTSGAYGHTLGRAVGIAAISPAVSLDAPFTVECKGERYPATVSRRPFYDARGERLRG
ncbi:MAG: FAD-dependent oxidoreductase [Actinobacteria bacterium]|nr:FAD-dependent oxidoreductase [Actinomycetota bacterium]MBU1607973.1 FAD-dependent oxidoreductase [Actinomycetota bacterium]MBU2316149.1 FAD-dependent oxidoreductase [Actinomycetota bacterium]MBU2386179.1 FAD-dependent oxidoreductase [Actinomycetota bacterium]